MKKNDIIKYSIFAIVGILVGYFIFRNFSFQEFKVDLKKANVWFVLLSVSVGVFAVLIRALRWQIVLEPLGYNTKLGNSYHSIMTGYLVNLGIPRSGEITRCALMSKSENIPLNVLIGTVLSERILDLIMLIIVITGSVILQFDLLYNYINENVLLKLKGNEWILYTVLIVMVFGLIFLFKSNSVLKGEGKLMKMIKGFIDGVKSIFTIKKPVLYIFYTVLIWFCYWMMTYTLILAFDFTQSIGLAGSLAILVFSSLGVIIPAPAGGATIGTVQVGLNQLFKLAESQAKSFAIVMFTSNIIMIIFAGTISYIIMAKRVKT